MSYSGKSPSDQKTLNEELIEGLVEVAQRNPQHAVELFGVTAGLVFVVGLVLAAGVVFVAGLAFG